MLMARPVPLQEQLVGPEASPLIPEQLQGSPLFVVAASGR